MRLEYRILDRRRNSLNTNDQGNNRWLDYFTFWLLKSVDVKGEIPLSRPAKTDIITWLSVFPFCRVCTFIPIYHRSQSHAASCFISTVYTCIFFVCFVYLGLLDEIVCDVWVLIHGWTTGTSKILWDEMMCVAGESIKWSVNRDGRLERAKCVLDI